MRYERVFLYDHVARTELSTDVGTFIEPFKPGEAFSRTWSTKHQII